MTFFENLRNYPENTANIRNIMGVFIDRVFHKNMNLHNILRVFRLEDRLTVFRALYIIQKRFRRAKGFLGQRLLVFWTNKIF